MAFQTRAALGILAQQVADETAPGLNTADRVGTILQNMVDSTVNYRSYAANLTQFGTIAPSEDAVFSALPQGAVIWTRTGAGAYTGTLAGAFPVGKVPYKSGTTAGSTATSVKTWAMQRATNNTVSLTTFVDAVPADGVLEGDFIEIPVYP